jgi:hypothetical protein
MSLSNPDHQDTSVSLPYLGPLSALSAISFPSTDALIQAILALITDQVGLRTSFLTQISPSENRNHIIAVHQQPNGCELVADIDLPLEDTF